MHYAGNPVDLDRLNKISKNYNIPIIEDSAHAMGSEYKGKPIGSSGNICCFSFQCVKIVTCGDGGVVTCGNRKTYEKLRLRFDAASTKKKLLFKSSPENLMV